MFNGVNPEQFHQFIASRSALPLPLPLTLPLHVSPSAFSIHEIQPSQQVFQSHLLHPMHHRQHSTHEDEEKGEEGVVGRSLELDVMRSESQIMDPWLKEEVVALLAIRSSLGNEFSDFIWSHVSRKLAELGFKRSAEKCKEKFEEVSKYCSNTSYGNSHYRSFNELEALFEDQTHSTSLDDKMERTNNEEGEEQEKMDVNMEENSANETLENPIEENQYVQKKPKRKKKKKHHQFELLKGFSEFVNKIMVQQEELHMKLLQDMERREEERVAREEAWKRKEMEKLYKEMEIRAQEQAIACDRETKIIEFLNQFSTSNIIPQLQVDYEAFKTPKSSNPPNPPLNTLPQNPNSLVKETTPSNQNVHTSSAIVLSPPSNQVSSTSQNNPSPLQNPSPLTTQNPNTSFNERDDYGKRWPRDEVNSLINLRCNLQTNSDDKESTKAPLWERISQGMLELGYKRSAKKCKEKWENINKYFRKTKDANKKRPLDSKTCPYFHQLNTLYNQGRLVMPSEGAENNNSNTPEKPTVMPPENGGNNQDNFQVNEGEKNMVQVPLEFEY